MEGQPAPTSEAMYLISPNTRPTPRRVHGAEEIARGGLGGVGPPIAHIGIFSCVTVPSFQLTSRGVKSNPPSCSTTPKVLLRSNRSHGLCSARRFGTASMTD